MDLKALYKEFSDSGIFTIYGLSRSTGNETDTLKGGPQVALEVRVLATEN